MNLENTAKQTIINRLRGSKYNAEKAFYKTLATPAQTTARVIPIGCYHEQKIVGPFTARALGDALIETGRRNTDLIQAMISHAIEMGGTINSPYAARA